ncbi:unnamed protein product [Cuscuta campestris]|uniref:Protein kinase domain-containing protein n=1 Tax=Cuscuta campestris TaxID=132261 RepID=A0A484L542_9ASTE|nr:unnamed protein product [Cuscuta campestris]
MFSSSFYTREKDKELIVFSTTPDLENLEIHLCGKRFTLGLVCSVEKERDPSIWCGRVPSLGICLVRPSISSCGSPRPVVVKDLASGRRRRRSPRRRVERLQPPPRVSLGSLIRPGYDGTTLIHKSDVSFYAYQILMGLSHVHEKGFVHNDLKPENILAFPAADGGRLFRLKLADFGVSTLAGKKDVTYYDDDEEEEEDDDDEEEPFCPHHCRGSLFYASPEYLATGKHNTGDDIWALGCIVLEMLTGEPAWLCKDSNDLIDQILYEKPEIPEEVPATARDFLSKCFLKREPWGEERWTARKLLKHPFVRDNKDVAACLAPMELGFEDGKRNPLLGCEEEEDDDEQWVSTEDLFLPFRSY